MIGQSYNKEKITKQVLNFYNKNHKIVVRDLKSANNLPTIQGIIHIWGSFQNCLKELGIYKETPSFNRECKSDEQMLSELKSFTNEYLKTHVFLPTLDVIDKEKSLSSSGTYTRRFGDVKNWFKLIGYDENFNHKALLEDMKRKYIACCEKYNMTLDSRDIERLRPTEDIYSVSGILNNFTSFVDFQMECGYLPAQVGFTVTKEESLDLLLKFAQELGRTPTQKDIQECQWLPSPCYYNTHFGGIKNALKQIGITDPKKYISSKGVRCNSHYEVKIANALEKKNISYAKEIYYKDVIPHFEKHYRFDFKITKNCVDYYIEYFGIIGIESYDKKTAEKQEICNVNNINLISLFQEDIYSKSYDGIYTLIMQKVEEIRKDQFNI